MTFDILIIEDENDYINDTIDGLNISGKPNFGVIPDSYLTAKEFFSSENINLKLLQFTLALVDYNLPGGINGDQVIKEIRKNNSNYNLPIIFYSADKTPGELKAIVEKIVGKDIDGILYSTKESLEDECFRFLNNRCDELKSKDDGF